MMKKIIICIFLIIVVVCIVAYAYLNYVANYNDAQKENKKFEYYQIQKMKLQKMNKENILKTKTIQ